MKRILLLPFLGVTILSFGQTEKPDLVTDRPDQTEAPVLVPKGGLQVETGFQYEKDRQDGLEQTNFTYNTTLIKYGVNDHFELRFITEYLGERSKIAENQISRTQGISPLALGVKIKLAEEKGFWPQAAFIGHINLRTGSKDFNPNYTAADFRFTFAHTLSEKFSLSYNLGAEWNGETPDAAFLYTLSLGYAATNRLGMFVESYSFFPEKDKADNRFDCGVTYKFTPVLQWDISGGVGLSRSAPDYFLSTGLSFRLFR
ncbi:MAG TPA: transporter [Chryseolinea sp.]